MFFVDRFCQKAFRTKYHIKNLPVFEDTGTDGLDAVDDATRFSCLQSEIDNSGIGFDITLAAE